METNTISPILKYSMEGIDFERNDERLTLKATQINRRCKGGVKVHFYHSFRSKESLFLFQDKFLFDTKKRIVNEQIKKKKLEECKSKPHFEVGHIVYESWGWEQTNIDFFQVVEVKGSFVTVRQIAQETKETGFMSGYTTPIRDKFLDENTMRKKVLWSKWDDMPQPYLKGCFHGIMHLHKEGEKHSCSWYA